MKKSLFLLLGLLFLAALAGCTASNINLDGLYSGTAEFNDGTKYELEVYIKRQANDNQLFLEVKKDLSFTLTYTTGQPPTTYTLRAGASGGGQIYDGKDTVLAAFWLESPREQNSSNTSYGIGGWFTVDEFGSKVTSRPATSDYPTSLKSLTLTRK